MLSLTEWPFTRGSVPFFLQFSQFSEMSALLCTVFILPSNSCHRERVRERQTGYQPH